MINGTFDVVMSYKLFILQKTCSVMKCIIHWIVNDLNQDLRVWWDCTASFWSLSTSKQGFFRVTGGFGGSGRVHVIHRLEKQRFKWPHLCFQSRQTLRHLSIPPSSPSCCVPLLCLSKLLLSFHPLLVCVLSLFFSVTKSPAHQAAKTAAGPERLLQSGQLHLSWINDLSRCFANSSKCVIVTVIICENAAWRLQFIYPWNIESLQWSYKLFLRISSSGFIRFV